MATAPSPWWEHCGVVNGMGIDHPTRGLGYVVGFNIVRDGVLVEFSDGESHCYQERSWAKLSAAASKDVEVRTLDRMPQPRSMHDMKAFVKEFEDAEMDARKGTNFRRRATAAVVNLTGMKSLKRRHSLGGKVDYWGTGSRKKALRANLKGRELRQHSARVINRFMKHQFDTKRMVSKIDIVMVTHELKRKRRGCHALLRFISFAVLFFTIITLQKKPWHAYSVEKSLLETGQKIRFFENDDYGWEDIASVDDVKKWVKSALAKLHVKGDAAALRTRDPSNTYVANYNHVVGGIAIRQWRYSRAACDNVYPRAYIPEYAVECQDGENLVIDYLGDRTPFGVNGSKFVWSDEWENGFAQMIDLGVYGSTKEQSVAAWDRLLADGWMDQETREMRLSMVTFNGNLGLFGMLNVQFYFHRGGHISRVQSVSSVVVANTYTYPDWIRVGFEIVFVGWTFGQLWKTAALWCRNPLHFWTKFFNIINVVAYTNLTASFVMWTYICIYGRMWTPTTIDGAVVSTGMLNYPSLVDESRLLLRMAHVQRAYAWSNTFAMVLMVIRMLTHLNFHRRLAIVTTTIFHAATDLLHFLIPFSMIISCYAFIAWSLIGRQNDNFATFERSLVSLILVAMGDFSLWPDVQAIEREIGPLFFLSYVFLVTVLMINIVLAIVVDAFMSSANARTSKKSDRSTLAADVFIITYMDCIEMKHYTYLCCTMCGMACKRYEGFDSNDEPKLSPTQVLERSSTMYQPAGGLGSFVEEYDWQSEKAEAIRRSSVVKIQDPKARLKAVMTAVRGSVALRTRTREEMNGAKGSSKDGADNMALDGGVELGEIQQAPSAEVQRDPTARGTFSRSNRRRSQMTEANLKHARPIRFIRGICPCNPCWKKFANSFYVPRNLDGVMIDIVSGGLYHYREEVDCHKMRFFLMGHGIPSYLVKTLLDKMVGAKSADISNQRQQKLVKFMMKENEGHQKQLVRDAVADMLDERLQRFTAGLERTMAKMNAVMEGQLEVTLNKMDQHIGAVESHLASDIARASGTAAPRGASSAATGRPAPLSRLESSLSGRYLPIPSLSPRNARYEESAAAAAMPAHFTQVPNDGDDRGAYYRSEHTGLTAWTVEELHEKEATAAMGGDSAEELFAAQRASDDLVVLATQRNPSIDAGLVI